jgi:hypothetical protein
MKGATPLGRRDGELDVVPFHARRIVVQRLDPAGHSHRPLTIGH